MGPAILSGSIDKMEDRLSHYQHDVHAPHVSRTDLVPHLAVQALRKIPHAHHVIRRHFSKQTRPVTQIHPPPYNNDGKMQMMHH